MQNTSETIEELNISNDQLDLILKKHPYFQLGQIEKSKRLRNENHIDALKSVRRCAILIPERSLLYSQFHSTEKEEVQISEDPVLESIDENEEVIPLVEDDSLSEIENSPIVNIEDIVEPIRVEEKKISDTPNEDVAPISEMLEKEYLVEAVNQSIQAEAQVYDVENIPLKKEEENDAKIERKEGILSFSEWLDGGVYLKEDDIQNDLIDKFIQESPQIQRLNDQSFYSPLEKGKESISDEHLLYSETLASIFIEQGNKSLAIKAYKYLMLKNPQKSVYFADLIKKLEE